MSQYSVDPASDCRMAWLPLRLGAGEGLPRPRDLYVAGLITARAMERESLLLLTDYLEALQDWPAMPKALCPHMAESVAQDERLRQLLEAMGVDAAAGEAEGYAAGGTGLAMPAAPAHPWDVLRLALAILHLKHGEAAFYRSIIPLCALAGQATAIDLLHRSLAEEESMAGWAQLNLDEVARSLAAEPETAEPETAEPVRVRKASADRLNLTNESANCASH